MEKVTGVGGVFTRSPDVERLGAWYQEHLGFEIEDWGGTIFPWQDRARPTKTGSTTWGLFAEDSDYFGSPQRTMVNYRVEDLAAMRAQLVAAGVEVVDHVEDTEYGQFGWAVDCDGTRFELWQPPPGM